MALYRCCADMQHAETGAAYDDRYGYPGEFRVLGCVACGHSQLGDPPGAEAQRALYSQYYPRAGFDPAAHQVYQPPGRVAAWLNGARAAAALWVRPGTRVLEIGCGYGEMIGYLKTLGCEVQATELDENVAKLARRQGYDIRLGFFDARNYPAGYFDYVLLNQVLEHVADPAVLLLQLREVLASGGEVVVSTPNGAGPLRRMFRRRWIQRHAPYHVQLFTQQSLRQLATATRFDVRLLGMVTPSSWLLYQWCHCVGYPPPGQRHPFWSESLPRTLAQRLAYRALYLATQAPRLNHLLARFLDAAGAGENLVAILRKSG